MYEAISSKFDHVFDTMYAIDPFLTGISFMLVCMLVAGAGGFITITVMDWINARRERRRRYNGTYWS